MLPADVRLISVDDHLIEHPGVWQDRLPAAARKEGPRVVEPTSGPWAGHEVWLLEGRQYPTMKHYAIAGQDRDGEAGPIRFSEMIPGCYDPFARLADMDADGVWAQLVFPEYSRFAGHRFLLGDDRELARLCIVAYNDFIIEQWCATAPERFTIASQFADSPSSVQLWVPGKARAARAASREAVHSPRTRRT